MLIDNQLKSMKKYIASINGVWDDELETDFRLSFERMNSAHDKFMASIMTKNVAKIMNIKDEEDSNLDTVLDFLNKELGLGKKGGDKQ